MITPSLRRLLRIFIVVSALLGPGLIAAPTAADFSKRWDISNVQISETGRYVSFLTPAKDDYYDLNLYDLETKETKKLDLRGSEIWNYWWIDGNRLVIHYTNGAVQAYDAQRNGILGTVRSAYEYLQYISSLRRNPDLFVVRYYDDWQSGGARAGLAVVNMRITPPLAGGLHKFRYHVKEWIQIPKGEHHGTFTDKDGEVRLVTVYQDKELQFYHRTTPDSPWVRLPFDYETTDVLGLADDPDLIYLSHYSAEARSSRLHRYRVSTGDFGPPIFEDPDYSMSGAWLMRRRQADGTSRILSLGYERDMYAQRSIDPLFAEVQAAINAKLPGRLNVIHDCDNQLRRFVVASASGREPDRFVIYDHSDGSLLPLPAAAPWLKPAEMSIKRPIKFTARDGLVLEGYLSLPPPPAGGAKPPLVVYPHGGPWSRDTWGFDSDVQFLTARGYAVFQPNYRGSIGYSRAVSKTDNYEFRKMHDDVTDGVRHLVAQNLVDGQRVAIFGGSFGGFLAVSGVAFEPSLYRCAVTFAGVFDWKQLIRQHKANRDDDKFSYDLLMKRLGDPATQEERFNAMSPILHVSAIKVPVFVIHGKLDSTVDYRQSTKLLSELKEHRVPHEKLIFDTEFHGFAERKNRQKFLEAVEKFLAKHL